MLVSKLALETLYADLQRKVKGLYKVTLEKDMLMYTYTQFSYDYSCISLLLIV